MLEKTMIPRTTGEMRALEERSSQAAIGVAERQERTKTSFDANAIDRPSISVVIPTLDEADNLPHVLPAIPSYVDEVIIVDGRSTDNTVHVAKALRPDVRIVYEKTDRKSVV